MIDSTPGRISPGKCRRCGQTREFPNYAWETPSGDGPQLSDGPPSGEIDPEHAEEPVWDGLDTPGPKADHIPLFSDLREEDEEY